MTEQEKEHVLTLHTELLAQIHYLDTFKLDEGMILQTLLYRKYTPISKTTVQLIDEYAITWELLISLYPYWCVAKGYTTETTLLQIAEFLNLTRERIRQINLSALQKLKHPKLARKLQSLKPLLALLEKGHDAVIER